MSRIRLIATAPLLAVLAACNAVVLHPSGDVAEQQRDLLVSSTLLMLLIIVPVMAMTVAFAWKYRASNKAARYEPDWDHSIHLELMIWAVPLLIIIALGAMTWLGTHLLDPYRSLDRVRPNQTAAQPVSPPLVVEAVALDWKWLFIYPQYGVATVNELAAPVDRPITFMITSESVMNSLYIPALAGQIYAMPGMQTQLHAVANRVGDYGGISANYSGAGFSDMHFAFHVQTAAEFDNWIARVAASGSQLDRATYLDLSQQSVREPVHLYGHVERGLYDAIVNRCVAAGKTCERDWMNVDAGGGMKMSRASSADLPADLAAQRDAALCRVAASDTAPLVGAGLRAPTLFSARPPAPVAMALN